MGAGEYACTACQSECEEPAKLTRRGVEGPWWNLARLSLRVQTSGRGVKVKGVCIAGDGEKAAESRR